MTGCSSAGPPVSSGGQKDAATRIQPRHQSETVVGYYAWWTRGAWMDVDLEVYDKLIFFSTTPFADGSLRSRNGWPLAWGALLQEARNLGIPVVPTLALMEADSIRSLFGSKAARDRLMETALTLISESQGAGLHLDIELFESAPDSVRDGFLAFTDSLGIIVKQRYPSAELSMFTPAFDYGGLYDLSRISPDFTELMVQGYDLHWRTGPKAGPVSPKKGWDGANWESVLNRYETSGISANRIVMTVPYYGYEWPVESNAPGSSTRGEGRITTFGVVDSLNVPGLTVAVQDRIEEFGMSRDPVSRSPYYAFEDSTGWWQGWYEDALSLNEKYLFARERGIKGIAVFPIGYGTRRLDQSLLNVYGMRLPLGQ